MEELTDLESFMTTITIPEVTYDAVYDPETGKVTCVSPSHAVADEKYKLSLDSETALMIIEGSINIHNCFINDKINKLELSEVKSLKKLDDVLHRIIDSNWSDIKKPDVYISYTRTDQELSFSLTEELGGTYILSEEFQPVVSRNIRWDIETELNFLITDYNDPNILYNLVSIKLSDLLGSSKLISNMELPEKFSIYTRRIFDNYLMEYK